MAELFEHALIDGHVTDPWFVAREWLLERIEVGLAHPDCRLVVITGAPGSGKTTLMAWLAHRFPNWPRYFIRRVGETENGDEHRHEGSLASFLTVTGLQLAACRPDLFPGLDELLEMEGVVEAGSVTAGGRATSVVIDEWVAHPFRKLAARVTLRAGEVGGEVIAAHVGRLIDASAAPAEALSGPALFEPARRLARRSPGEKIVILLDGLDELRFRTVGADVAEWLASVARLPDNVRIVLTSRPQDARLTPIRHKHGAAVQMIELDDEPARENVLDDIRHYADLIAADPRVVAAVAARSVVPERFTRQVMEKSAGNFQYLAFLARAVVAATSSAELDWLRDLSALPPGLSGLYDVFLTRVRDRVVQAAWTGSPWQDVYLPILGLLAVARAPLDPAQIATFTGVPGGQRACRTALAALRQFLDGGEPTGSYRLFHTSLADFLQVEADSELLVEEIVWHGRITEYGVGRHAADGSWHDCDPYLRVHLAAHAAEVGRLDELMDDPRYLIAADPTGLLESCGVVTRAEPIARLYRQVAALLHEGDVANALAHLDMYARQVGESAFAARVAAVREAGPWAMSWAHWDGRTDARLLGSHGAEITSIGGAHLSDGTPVAVCGGQDGRLSIWNLRTGREAGRLTHAWDGDRYTRITALAAGELGSGESYVVSGGDDGMVRVWGLDTMNPIGAPMARAESAGRAIAVGPSLAVCVVHDTVRLWDTSSAVPAGPPIPVLAARVAALGVCDGRVIVAVAQGGSAPLGTTYAMGGTDGFAEDAVTVWDAMTGHVVGVPIHPEEGGIRALAVAEVDGEPLVIIGDSRGGIQAWHPLTGRPAGTRLESPDDRFDAVALGRLGGRMVAATGSRAGLIQVRDPRTLCALGEPAQSVQVTALTVEEGRLASAGADGSIRFWAGIPPRPRDEPIHVTGPSAGLAFAGPDRLLTCDSRYRVWEWDTHTDALRAGPLFGSHTHVRALAHAVVDGRVVVVSCVGEIVRSWDILTGAESRVPLPGYEDVSTGLLWADPLATGTDGRRPVAISKRGHVVDLSTGELAQLPAMPDGVSGMDIGLLGGRPVVLFGTTAACVETRDLETSEAARLPAYDTGPGRLISVVVVDPDLVVAAGTDSVARVWTSGESPARLVRLPENVQAFTVARIDGHLVGVTGSRGGNVYVTDLDLPGAPLQISGPTYDLAVADGALICATGHGVRVLELASGDPLPAPEIGDGEPVAVDTGHLAGLPIGVCLVRKGSSYLLHTWRLDTGEPLPEQPIPLHGRSECLAVATLNGRPVAALDGMPVVDLQTGAPMSYPDLYLGERLVGVAVVSADGRPVVLGARSGGGRRQIKSAYLDGSVVETSSPEAQEDAPLAPPRIGRGYEDPLNHPPGSMGMAVLRPQVDTALPDLIVPSSPSCEAMTAGTFDGVPIVISGYSHGRIDLFTVDTALPLGPPLAGDGGRITALAYEHLGGRPFLASGDESGTVRVRDLKAGSVLTTIHVNGGVSHVALAPPDWCVIGSDRGVITIRLTIPGHVGGPVLEPPRDPRAARVCPVHPVHVAARLAGSGHQEHLAIRICVKGVVTDTSSTRIPGYPHGHCYLTPDEIVIASAEQPAWQLDGLRYGLGDIRCDPVDDPDAHRSDGCHFGLAVSDASAYRTVSCYRRSERDLMIRLIRRNMAAYDNRRGHRQ